MLPGPERHLLACFCWSCPANVAGERSLWLSFQLESWEQPVADHLRVLQVAAAVVVTTTPAAPGTYNIQVSASATTSAGLIVHNATVVFTVQ